MRAYDLILKKRNGEALLPGEIEYLVQGFVKGDIPDYQMAALCMAVFFQGLDPLETALLTRAMAESGDRVDLSAIPGIKVDKHSTGGVGDKTTLVVVPLAASLGVPVAKMSGRGLGHTGGTVDKLESIPGFRTHLSLGQLIETVKRTGAAIVGQTGNLVPADKKLYALRDVTATVDSIPLIASSIMSKKIASGCDALVLDVKVGSGAFMKKLGDARSLAKLMLDMGTAMGIKVSAVLSSANQPLGRAVGNALEVKEAVETLKGSGPDDVEEVCLEIASQMLLAGGQTHDRDSAFIQVKEALATGRALKKFQEMIQAQGGNPQVVEDEKLLPQGEFSHEVLSSISGFVQEIDTEKVGMAAVYLGAGRSRKEDAVDHGAGLIIHKKIGDWVAEKDSLATLYFNQQVDPEPAAELIKKAMGIGREKPGQEPLIFEILSQSHHN